MPVTQRDLARMAGCHPLLVAKFTTVSRGADKIGTPVFVVGGVRTALQQSVDYAIGRTTGIPGHVVTYCDGYTHKGPHQPHADGYGYAIDFAFVPSKDRPDPFDKTWPWGDLGDLIENQGLIWGGRWVGHLVDLDHMELPDPPQVSA